MNASRNVRLLGWLNFFVNFRFYAPLAILYFAEVSGSYGLGGIVLSAVMIAGAVAEIPTGIFSDRIGRRATMIASAVCSTVAVVAYASAGSFALLLVGAVADGVSRAFYSGTNQAMLYETLEQSGSSDRYAHHSGRMRAMYQASAAIGAVGASAILAASSLRWLFWLSLLPRAICLVVAFRLEEPDQHSKQTAGSVAQLVTAARNTWQNKRLLRLLVPSTVIYAAGEASYQFQAAFVALFWPAWTIGLFRASMNGFAAVSNWFAGWTLDRFGTTRTLFASQLFSRASGIAAFVWPTVASPALMIAQSVPYGPSVTALDALSQAEFTSQERATMASLAAFAGSILLAAFVTTVGFVADHFGPAKGLLLAEVAMLAAVPLLWSVHRRHSERATEPSSSL